MRTKHLIHIAIGIVGASMLMGGANGYDWGSGGSGPGGPDAYFAKLTGRAEPRWEAPQSSAATRYAAAVRACDQIDWKSASCRKLRR